jgi:zinc-ribbon domain
MSNHMTCSECGEDLKAGHKFCSKCGAEIEWTVESLREAISAELSEDKKVKSSGKKWFLGFWIFINMIYVSQFFVASSQPVDRFRFLCNTEVTCGPSSQDKAMNAFGNLLIWNLIFLGIWIYRKRKRR